MEKKFLQNYFFLLFLLLPISIIVGPALSLINILLIDLSFIIFIFYTKKFDIFNHKVVRILIILYLYLIFNSFIALDFNLSIKRNFGFLRFIVLFVGINYFFYYFSKFDKILFFWYVINVDPKIGEMEGIGPYFLLSIALVTVIFVFKSREFEILKLPSKDPP